MFLKRGRTFPLAATTHDLERRGDPKPWLTLRLPSLGSLVDGPWVPLLSAKSCDSDLGQVSMRGMAEKKKITQPRVLAFSAQFCTWVLR